MKCPDCKSNTQVLESRTRAHWRYRRRRCPRCQKVFSTKEELVSETGKLARELAKSTEKALRAYGTK